MEVVTISQMEPKKTVQSTLYVSTSSNKGGVGKTTTTLSLILSCAELGLKCLYIEQDYGNPSGHKYLGLKGVVNPETERGVGELLLGKQNHLEDVIHKTFPHNLKLRQNFPKLDYVSCGTVEVSERSARTDFREGYQKVKEEAKSLGYQVVIFDMPAGIDPYVLDGVLRTKRVLILNPDPLNNSRDGALRLLRNARTRAINKLALGLNIPHNLKKPILEILGKELRKETRENLLDKIKTIVENRASDKFEAYDKMESYIKNFGSYVIFTNGASELCNQHMLDLTLEAEKYGLNITQLRSIPFSNSIRNAQPFFYYNDQIVRAAEQGQGPILAVRAVRDRLFNITNFEVNSEVEQNEN